MKAIQTGGVLNALVDKVKANADLALQLQAIQQHPELNTPALIRPAAAQAGLR
ncbi:MAG: hypothetical protein R3F47_19525 [Gammaproteobacteria bacterium]